MGKFKFYQDKEFKTCVRDYFYVYAETLEEAIALIQKEDCSMDDLERRLPNKVEFYERDMDTTMEWFCEDSTQKPMLSLSINSCDLEVAREDSEVIYREIEN